MPTRTNWTRKIISNVRKTDEVIVPSITHPSLGVIWAGKARASFFNSGFSKYSSVNQSTSLPEIFSLKSIAAVEDFVAVTVPVGSENYALPIVGAVDESLPDVAPGNRIHARGRLVQEQQRGFPYHCYCRAQFSLVPSTVRPTVLVLVLRQSYSDLSNKLFKFKLEFLESVILSDFAFTKKFQRNI